MANESTSISKEQMFRKIMPSAGAAPVGRPAVHAAPHPPQQGIHHPPQQPLQHMPQQAVPHPQQQPLQQAPHQQAPQQAVPQPPQQPLPQAPQQQAAPQQAVPQPPQQPLPQAPQQQAAPQQAVPQPPQQPLQQAPQQQAAPQQAVPQPPQQPLQQAPPQQAAPASQPIAEPAVESVPINLAEILVERNYTRYRKRLGGCECQRCKDDVFGMTLNRVKPHYVPSHHFDEADLTNRQMVSETIAALVYSIFQVKRSPHHKGTGTVRN